MIHTLKITGFKSLQHAEIDLGRLNCFIGANGVGKSNLLEALGVLGAAANGVVDDESLLRRGVRAGLPRLFKSSFSAERTPAHIGLGATGEHGEEYRISLLNPLNSPEPAWSYKTEFWSDGEKDIVSDGVRNKKNLNPQKGLAALRMVDLSEKNSAAKLLRCLQSYAIYCPNTPTLRGVVPDQQSRYPMGLSGGQLPVAFEAMREYLSFDKKNGDDLLDQVFSLIDWVSDVQTTNHGGMLMSDMVPRTKVMLKFVDRFMAKSRNELTAYDASEGALYVLFCAALCLLPNGPRVFAIDNLDSALNPRLVSRLVQRLSEWLRYGDSERQLLFTAHNPAVLDGLDLRDDGTRLFAVDRNSDGMTVIRRITPTAELSNLNATYPLSRLWMMGNLGAVPNV